MNKQLTLGVAAALLIGTGLCAPAAHAQPSSFTVTLTQEGPDVVADGSGTINTTDLQESTTGSTLGQMNPSTGLIYTGQPSRFEDFTGVVSTPTNFGSGAFILASSGTGNIVGVSSRFAEVIVPAGYDSGSFEMNSSTYDNTTLSKLGVTPGTYVWTWGSGANAGSFTLKAEEAAVPEPATLGLMVLGLLGVGFSGRKRRY